MRWIIYSFLLSMSVFCMAAEQQYMPKVPGQEQLSQEQISQDKAAQKKVSAEKPETWWEKRDQRSDIYYPHKAHYEVMEEEGDSCLLCMLSKKIPSMMKAKGSCLTPLPMSHWKLFVMIVMSMNYAAHGVAMSAMMIQKQSGLQIIILAISSYMAKIVLRERQFVRPVI